MQGRALASNWIFKPESLQSLPEMKDYELKFSYDEKKFFRA